MIRRSTQSRLHNHRARKGFLSGSFYIAPPLQFKKCTFQQTLPIRSIRSPNPLAVNNGLRACGSHRVKKKRYNQRIGAAMTHKLSRRQAPKILAVLECSLATSAFLPIHWSAPRVEVRFLPVHAQASEPTPYPPPPYSSP
jgi:hypothetical protein